jgi:hypothetical protein
MKKCIFFVYLTLNLSFIFGQQSRFEKSKGTETATYFEAIDWYYSLAKKSKYITIKTMGQTDAGYPLHLILLNTTIDKKIVNTSSTNQVIILVNNGIHPGEPDGIDASMLFARDVATGRIILPANVVIAIIPVYNIGGCLNRNGYSRVNQNGPIEYGFRGNAQNLDLNRDFIKCDSKEAQSFAEIFHKLQPDILIDNHVSDGADYQYTMTLLTTQYDKLGSTLGSWLKSTFEPALYKSMAQKNWAMTPYVNFETENAATGMQMFYDSPRYSSGYAALFGTLAFVPETHMLKPYKDRVQATYSFLQTMAEQASVHALNIKLMRAKQMAETLTKKQFALSWQVDSLEHSTILFKGYEQAFKQSKATGLQQMYYNHEMPFEKNIIFYNKFIPKNFVDAPSAYIIPQGWHAVIELLKKNGIQFKRFNKDTIITVQAYKITQFKSYSNPYEKHHKNYGVKTTVEQQAILFLKGDYYIPTQQIAKRYLIETLEPTGEDGFFAWNYFDAILQQKEGYSDYRWDEIAAKVLEKDTLLQQKLLTKKSQDTVFANSAAAQLEFIYKNSPYYEPVHLRYPVFRTIQ